MDDILSGAFTANAEQLLRYQLTHLCMAGGFPLWKWTSNDSSLLMDIPSEHCFRRSDGALLPIESHSILGLRWDPTSDLFMFSVSKPLILQPIKRTILTDIFARLFDPLGWLVPVVIRVKLLIQAA